MWTGRCRDDLGIADGLAAENVYVLDPCLRHWGLSGGGAAAHRGQSSPAAGWGALIGSRVKQAATERVFGFEIMPAAFVVAHLQVGLTMQDLDAPLADDGTERASIYLTNALTGWEARTNNPLPFPELEEERKHAGRVKRETPILVILGNPPYNGFAGMAVDEERELSDAYRTTKRVRRPEGQGLNDLYSPLLPDGGAADRGDDGPGRGLLHLQPIPGSTGYRSRACGSGISRRSTRSASTA